MSCSVSEDKFQELVDNGKSPVCLFPAYNACHSQYFNSEMFQKFGNKIYS